MDGERGWILAGVGGTVPALTVVTCARVGVRLTVEINVADAVAHDFKALAHLLERATESTL